MPALFFVWNGGSIARRNPPDSPDRKDYGFSARFQRDSGSLNRQNRSISLF